MGLKMAPSWPQMAPRGPKEPKESPKMAPRWPQEELYKQGVVLYSFGGALGGGSRGPKMDPRWPREAPKWLQEATRWPPEAHNGNSSW